MNLKIIRVRGHHLQLGPRQVHIGPVLRKIGGKSENLVTRLCHQAERMGQGPGSSHRHKDMLLTVRQSEPPLQELRHRLTHTGYPQTGAVAMERTGLLFVQHPDHLFRKFPGNGHGRVT